MGDIGSGYLAAAWALRFGALDRLYRAPMREGRARTLG